MSCCPTCGTADENQPDRGCGLLAIAAEKWKARALKAEAELLAATMPRHHGDWYEKDEDLIREVEAYTRKRK